MKTAAPSTLRLYNSLTKGEEPFAVEGNNVSMYTCGPTVYGRPHIGNYSSFLMADVLRRWLEVSGFQVKHVKNITDVGHLLHDADRGDDKIEKQAREEQSDPLAIAKKYEAMYLEDEAALNMLEPFARPRATETIPEMIAMIETLVERKHAYETADGVYFDVATFPQYGALSGNRVEQLNAGARVAVDETKRHSADFALWKKTVGENAHHVLKWSSPWGEGFPGWHIECSAMSRKFLGDTIDIHTGGEDNIFPHHECEIAQSESVTGQPFVRFWLHKRRIDLGDVKMSKSLGNVFTIPDIVAKGFSPLDLRYYLLSVHYRTNLKFSWKGLEDSRKARRKIVEWMGEKACHPEPVEGPTRVMVRRAHHDSSGFEETFSAAMNSDLNTPAALGVVFDAMTWSRNHPEVSFEAFMTTAQRTFGCFEVGEEKIPDDIIALRAERDRARAQKNFAESDRLRGEIEKRGFTVKDTKDGQLLRKK